MANDSRTRGHRIEGQFQRQLMEGGYHGMSCREYEAIALVRECSTKKKHTKEKEIEE